MCFVRHSYADFVLILEYMCNILRLLPVTQVMVTAWGMTWDGLDLKIQEEINSNRES